MLDFFRRNAQSYFFQGVVVVIILAFVFWGGSGMMNQREAAIMVNDEEISFQDFQKQYQQTMDQVAQRYGGQLPKGLAESLNIKQQVIQQMTQEALLRQGADDMGIVVSSDEIRSAILNMVQFQEDGQFSNAKYKAVLGYSRLSPKKFEKAMKRDLLADKTVQDISRFVTSITDHEVEELFYLEQEQFSINYVQADPRSYKDKVDVTDKELKTWFDQNSDNYTTQKEIQLRLVPFSYEKVAEDITVDEGGISQYYQDNIAAYTTAESRKASHILFTASADDSEEIHIEKKGKAEEVLALAKSGQDFAELAKTYSEGPSGPTGGELGYFGKGQMVKEFDDAVFSLDKGAIGDIVKTQFGYHIIYVEDIKEAAISSLEDEKDSIRQILAMQQAKPFTRQLATSAYENIITTGGLDQYLQENPDIEVQSTPFFSKDTAPPSIADKQELQEKAFLLDKGELSSLIETNEGFVILYADDIKEPAVPELARIKEKVTTDYISEKAAGLAKEAIEKLVSDSQTASFSEKAAEEGFTVHASDFFSKVSPTVSQAIPTTILASAFKLTGATPVHPEAIEIENEFYGVALNERKPPKDTLQEEDKAKYKQYLTEMKRQQILSAWLEKKRQESEVTIHPSLVEK